MIRQIIAKSINNIKNIENRIQYTCNVCHFIKLFKTNLDLIATQAIGSEVDISESFELSIYIVPSMYTCHLKLVYDIFSTGL